MTNRSNTPRLQNLRLDRPLIVFDLETTGTNPATDRIVQLAIVRFEPNIKPAGRRRPQKPRSFVRNFHPGRPVPAAATAVHGIGDEDVADAPPFGEVARWLAAEFAECDVAGFNVRRFDLPLLVHEMQRCGVELDLSGSRILDAYEIFTHFQPRTLEAAHLDYCGKEHKDSHHALGDVLATAAVLDAQVARHEALPAEAAGIDAMFGRPDLAGRLIELDGELALAFGKHKGRTLAGLARDEPAYLRWMLTACFLPDVKKAVREALEAGSR